jgi:hypothetical protein
VHQLLSQSLRKVKAYREAHGTSIEQARHAVNFGVQAIIRYQEITGFKELNPDGPPCGGCGKPLRTTKARYCVECGTPVNEFLALPG